jgi:CRISPR/Cas system-associated endonuclease/helicase Cas3
MNVDLSSCLAKTVTVTGGTKIAGADILTRCVIVGEDGEKDSPALRGSTRESGSYSSFAVGTIDQALMAVMNVKHNVVWAFGLAGKVVILDEVHSYDSYTGVILDELIGRLREMGCTIIILSATLTDTRRMSLLKRYGLIQQNAINKVGKSF